jgi:hypothetical protein
MEMFTDKAAGIVRILIKNLGRKQCIANDVPGNCMSDVIQHDVVWVHSELAFVAGAYWVPDSGIQSMSDENVCVVIAQVVGVVDYSGVLKVNPLVAAGDA